MKAGGGSTPSKTTFSVRFSYLPALGIVAVCPQTGSPPGILANLFPDDTGKTTPNPANHHSKAARASPLGIFDYPSDVPCRPYRWAQWLAGLHFPPPAAAALATTVGGADGAAAVAVALPIEPSMRSAVAALGSRARTRLALGGQLKAIAAGKGPSPLPGSKDDHLPEVTGEIGLRRCVQQLQAACGRAWPPRARALGCICRSKSLTFYGYTSSANRDKPL